MTVFITRHIPKAQQNWLTSSACSSVLVNKTEKTLLQPPLTEPEVHFIHAGLLLCNNRQSRNQWSFKLDALQKEFSYQNNKYRNLNFYIPCSVSSCNGKSLLFVLFFQRDLSEEWCGFSIVNIRSAYHVLERRVHACKWVTVCKIYLTDTY